MRFLFVLVGLTALALVAVPLTVGFFHLAVFGLVIWAAVCLLRGPRRPRSWERVYWSPPPRPVPSSRPPRPVPPSRPQRPAWQRLGSGLPLDVQVKIEQIRHKIDVLLAQRERFPFGSEELYIVRATRDDYLPRTLDAFMAVPPPLRDHAMPSGKTPLQELKEQLALLDTKLDEVAEDLQRRNVDRLLANRRFLEERFARPPIAV
jgi:hypothetical protein